ncbi:hypothetical protein SAMN06269185_3301 [Natronoarchaeum philippinense]|uniref:Uncharacterized protein n=1 Tax=Natronoarchaeum philippinense TaxID=558529 RepID=A0A285P9X1_NATPI|nr:hypothetical protein [Natronoarchaeum philippinense]SNZ18228.1 hypothetical protein SAMN06269185_3301 [Natronoarchaeum philippinense]
MATKQNAKNFTQDVDREHFEIPAEWAYAGSHETVDEETENRYYAEKICVETHLEGERVSATEIDYSEDVLMWVRYEHPETGDRVEEAYRAAAIERDGEIYYTPKVVRKGGPDKFKTSIAVPKRRTEEGR